MDLDIDVDVELWMHHMICSTSQLKPFSANCGCDGFMCIDKDRQSSMFAQCTSITCAMCNSTSCSHRGTLIQHARHDKAGRNCTKYNCIRNPDIQYFWSPVLFGKQYMLKHDDILLAASIYPYIINLLFKTLFLNSGTASLTTASGIWISILFLKHFKQRSCTSYNCGRIFIGIAMHCVFKNMIFCQLELHAIQLHPLFAVHF